MALSFDQKLSDAVSSFYNDPLGYVMFVFPWDTDQSIQMVKLEPPYSDRYNSEYGPDRWACEFLDELGVEIRKRGFNGQTAVEPIRFTTASGHGIGKSTLVAWLIKFILDTRPFSKGVVTANTSDQLRTKTWAELAKWNSISITSHLWHYTSGRGSMAIYRKGDKKLQQTWRCDAQTCREENAEAFQGLHAANATPFYIFDEASGIPDKIFEARSGGATDGEPMIFDFGNPTRKSGYFFENTVGKFRHRFIQRHVDSRTVKITNKGLINEWLNDWGEDSDFFKVKVRGVFPAAGSVQFISNDLVEACFRRSVPMERTAPLVIGVDVARYGADTTVIYPRIGNDARTFPYKRYMGLDNVQVAEKVIDMVQEFKALGKQVSMIAVDGGGLGGGVVDILRRLGYDPMDVNFGSRPSDNHYRLKSDELWGRMRDGMETLCLPPDIDMMSHLTQREYGITITNKIALESKEDLVKRNCPSPDIADALALTYASTPAVEFKSLYTQGGRVEHEYDPLNWKMNG